MPWLMLGLLLTWASPSYAVAYRWSDSSRRIYVDGPGSATPSDIKTALPKAPLEQVAPGVWHLRANILMDNGAKLVLHGTKIGGDVNQLRLQSNNNADSNAFVTITADWGSIDIRSTAITSWDDEVNGPDTEVWEFGRASIRVRSFLGDDLVTPNESRMDILDSDIGYLGFHEAESYGLTWKVNPPKNNDGYGDITNVYNLVNVYGDIKNCHIHNNFFGVYTFGAYGMHLSNNEVDHNIWYGFDPHDDSDSLTIENNNVHHNGTHGIIFSQRCDHATIRNNTTWENGHAGIMLHRYCVNSLIEGNRCLRNADFGIAIFANNNTTVRSNLCLGNVSGGMRFSVGSADNLIEGNELAYSPGMGFYFYKGIDAPALGDDGRPKRNRFINNHVHHNTGSGIYLSSGDDNVFSGNIFDANGGDFWFVSARNNQIDSNSIPVDKIIMTQGNPQFVSSTTIRNQPLAPILVDAYSLTTFEDFGGRVFDPLEPGLPTTATPTSSSLTLTMSDVAKQSTVATRELRVVPDAGVALVTINFWNTSGDLSKDWFVEASSATKSITYKVGNLAPNTQYRVLKNGVSSKVTTDSTGTLTYKDSAVTTGLVEYQVTP